MGDHTPSGSHIKVSEKKRNREIKPWRKQKWGCLERNARKAGGRRNLIARGLQAKRVPRMGSCLRRYCCGHCSDV